MLVELKSNEFNRLHERASALTPWSVTFTQPQTSRHLKKDKTVSYNVCTMGELAGVRLIIKLTGWALAINIKPQRSVSQRVISGIQSRVTRLSTILEHFARWFTRGKGLSTDETISCRQLFLIDNYMSWTMFCAINRAFTPDSFVVRQLCKISESLVTSSLYACLRYDNCRQLNDSHPQTTKSSQI